MNREAIMTALFNLLVSSIVTSFTGNTHSNTTIDNLSSTKGLFLGLPVFGPGVPSGTVISGIGSSSITLSQAATATAAGGAFSTGFVTTSRRLQHWGVVTAQPAMFLVSGRPGGGNHYPPRPPTILPKITLEPEIWIYSNAGSDPDLAPDSALNSILDAIDAALQPTGRDKVLGRLTLGGLVEHCWIEGEVEIFAGYLGPQALAIVPVRAMVPF